MKKLLILLCVMITVLFTTAAFWNSESEASDEDMYVPTAGKFTSVEEMRDKRIGVLTGRDEGSDLQNQMVLHIRNE